jgi:hypothetical protein
VVKESDFPFRRWWVALPCSVCPGFKAVAPENPLLFLCCSTFLKLASSDVRDYPWHCHLLGSPIMFVARSNNKLIPFINQPLTLPLILEPNHLTSYLCVIWTWLSLPLTSNPPFSWLPFECYCLAITGSNSEIINVTSQVLIITYSSSSYCLL